jgi:hypothetical protein
MDDDGDATLLIHESVKAEEIYEKTGNVLLTLTTLSQDM